MSSHTVEIPDVIFSTDYTIAEYGDGFDKPDTYKGIVRMWDVDVFYGEPTEDSYRAELDAQNQFALKLKQILN